MFFERCAREGGYPRDYFVARAALQAGSGTEQEVRDYLTAHHDATSPLLNGLRVCLGGGWAEGIEQLGRWGPRTRLRRP